ncbi:hypothetical protein ARTHRO8AJ_210096 [Arthrobacter sp. 8AJ]|nr:hypothetical protein ARTHRO8AJ_210096 [Arthrobacter sp. 8AJ]
MAAPRPVRRARRDRVRSLRPGNVARDPELSTGTKDPGRADDAAPVCTPAGLFSSSAVGTDAERSSNEAPLTTV